MLVAPPVVVANGTPISCPNGTTVWLEGQAPPNEALLVFLENRSVGGGSADRSGRYRIPLKLRERPGIYAVEVRTRASRTVVGRFECYVDVPLAEQPTPTGEIVVTAAVPVTSTATQPPAGVPTLRPTASPTTTRAAGSPSASPTTTSPRGTTATSSPTNSRVSPTPTNTAGPSPTTTQVEAEAITIDDIYPADVSNDEEEYVALYNNIDEDINITGWRVINTTRSGQPTYTFPRFVLESGSSVFLYTNRGENNLEIGDFYWNLDNSIWSPGDIAELRDNRGNLIHSYTVESDE